MVVLNLYTNALKAVLSATSSIRNPKVAIKAWNENGNHILECPITALEFRLNYEKKNLGSALHDNVGAPETRLGRAWVWVLVWLNTLSRMLRKIELLDEPPPEFSTCFRVKVPVDGLCHQYQSRSIRRYHGAQSAILDAVKKHLASDGARHRLSMELRSQRRMHSARMRIASKAVSSFLLMMMQR